MLHIYANYQAKPFSSGDRSNPLVITLDGSRQAQSVQQLLLHNDDALKVYRSITLQMPASQIPAGWTAKLIEQSRIPTAADWLLVSSGNILAMPDILDLNYYPFWIALTIPAGTSVQTLTSPGLLLNYSEQLP